MKDKTEIEQAISFGLEFEGMTSRNALVLMSFFLSRLLDSELKGSLAEFGTYKGRVAAFFGKLARGRELELVDLGDYLEKDRLEGEGIRFKYFNCRSEDYLERQERLAGKCKYLVSHHDASHYFENVKTEVGVISKLFNPEGLIILDDFTDPFNQVRAAYYYLRYVEKMEFELIMIGFGKAILCHSDYFSKWEKFIVEELVKYCSDFGVSSTLYRTDLNQYSRAFSIALKKKPSDPDLYGLNTYGDRFYKS
jgi:hypothetical protein